MGIDPDNYLTEGGTPATPPPTPTGTGRYLVLEVPNFTALPDADPNPLGTYLCLGAAYGAPPSTNADALANMVQGFTDDTRVRNQPTEPTQSAPPDGGVTPATPGANPMLNESGVLHTKGGWRDHSDGNRISTTLGDKVEVIRGNYKLLVLGRQGDPSNPGAVTTPSGMEHSGGLVDMDSTDLGLPPNTTTPVDQTVLNTEYVWEQNSDTTWGWTMRTRVGSPTAANGKTISYTWVDELWTFVGSPTPPTRQPSFDPAHVVAPDEWPAGPSAPPRPVKKICTRTWGETILQEVRAHAMQPAPGATAPSPGRNNPAKLVVNAISDGTYNQLTSSAGEMGIVAQTIDGAPLTSLVETFGGGDLVQTLQSSGTLGNNVMAEGAVHSVTTSSDMIDEFWQAKNAHNLLDMTLLLRSEIDLAVIMISEIKAAILIPEVKLGIHMDTHLGMHLDSHYGLHLEFHVGPHLQFRTASVQDDEVTLYTSDVHAVQSGVVSLGAGAGAPAAAGATPAAGGGAGAAQGAEAATGATGAQGAETLNQTAANILGGSILGQFATTGVGGGETPYGESQEPNPNEGAPGSAPPPESSPESTDDPAPDSWEPL